jgi:hypothetical protein
MKRMPDKDLYSILGVAPNATQEQIREAYVARARVIHPDRFDRQQQFRDWNQANEMLSELNESYRILRDPTNRGEYDRRRNGKVGSQESKLNPNESESPPPQFDIREISTGFTRFSDLSERAQVLLRKRQEGRVADQIQLKTASIRRKVVLVVIPLFWFLYLFSNVGGGSWKDGTLFFYAVCTIAAALIIGRNLAAVVRWNESTLKPFFYITPLYFIRTEFDVVSFRPIWTVKEAAITHNPRNGSYRHFDIVFTFEGHSESVPVSSKDSTEEVLNRIDTYNTTLKRELERRNYGYLEKHDDFFGVPRSDSPFSCVPLHPAKKIGLYAASLLICLGGLWIAGLLNNASSKQRSVQHQEPAVYSPESPAPDPIRRPKAGGSQTLHSGIYGYMDDKGVRHMTNEKPMGGPHRVLVPDTTSSPIPREEPPIPKQALPASGSVRRHTEGEAVAPFQIKADRGSHYLLKLVDVRNGLPALTVFVRSGTTVEIEVPEGSFEVRYASGEAWYGYKYLFGPDTVYSKADKVFAFEVVDNRVRGYRITLYKVPNGNLHTRTIKPAEF